MMETELSRKVCPNFELLLENFLEGELAEPEAERVGQHIKSCAACRGAFEDARASRELLSTAEPTADPGAGFARTVMARIRAEQERTAAEGGFWQPLVSLAWRFALSATLVLAVMIGYAATWQRQARDLAVVRAADTRDIFSDPERPPRNRDEVLLMVAETNHANH